MESQYKVLHILTRMLPGGGAERNTIYTIKGLKKENYIVDLVVGRDSDLSWHLSNDISITKLDELVRDRNLLLDLKALFSLYKIIRKGHYDVVHTHHAKAGMLGRLAARLANVPIIIHGLHGVTFHPNLNPVIRQVYIFLERISEKYTDYFISVGKDLRNKYLKHRVGSPSKYEVIHSGMELDVFHEASQLSVEYISRKKEELGLKPNDVVIGKVASLEPRKGHEYVIQAAPRILEKHPEVKFVFVGDGWRYQEIKTMIDSCGLNNQIILTGFRTDIAEVIATFDISLLTSLWEGLPQVLVQAAAVGKPIVTFDVEGAREVVQAGLNGFIVPLKDIDGLIQKLNVLLNNLERARNMGLKGQQLIIDNWKIETMVEKTIMFYNEVVKRLEK